MLFGHKIGHLATLIQTYLLHKKSTININIFLKLITFSICINHVLTQTQIDPPAAEKGSTAQLQLSLIFRISNEKWI